MKILWTLMVTALALVAPAHGATDWCYNGPHDMIYATVESGTITVRHDAALYNCCPDSIGYAWSQEGTRFTVVETEYNPTCMCLCCFDLTTSMQNVPPGFYEIAFRWERLGHAHEQILQVIVPDEGQSGEAAEGPATSSACLQNQPAGIGSDESSGARLTILPIGPNPVRDDALIRFELPAAGRASLAVYSSAGTIVRVLLDENLEAGIHAVSWDGRDAQGRRMSQGIYFCGLRLGAETAARSLIVLR